MITFLVFAYAIPKEALVEAPPIAHARQGGLPLEVLPIHNNFGSSEARPTPDRPAAVPPEGVAYY